MTLARWQSLALGVAVGALVLGFLASIGFLLLPILPGWLLWLAHPALAAAGAAAGRGAARRGREIDAQRWAVIDEPLATAHEREHAHEEAERERRLSATVFLAAPVFIGYWWLYQFGAVGAGVWTLALTALVTFFAGFAFENRRGGPERRF